MSEYPFDPEFDQAPRSGRRLNLIEGNTVNHRLRPVKALKGLTATRRLRSQLRSARYSYWPAPVAARRACWPIVRRF